MIGGRTVVFNGDVLSDLDLGAVLKQHEETGAKATIVLTPVENPTAYGLVETEDDGRVRQFLEKPSYDEITCDTINAGVYILEPETLDRIPEGESYSFERGFFPSLLKDKIPFYAYVHRGYWIDIGTPQKYAQVHQDIFDDRYAAGPFLGLEQPHRAIAHLRREFVCRLAHIGSVLSQVGASGKPGMPQFAFDHAIRACLGAR